jgi:hypothetical protein
MLGEQQHQDINQYTYPVLLSTVLVPSHHYFSNGWLSPHQSPDSTIPFILTRYKTNRTNCYQPKVNGINWSSLR